jgi:hypothetical protein
MNPELIQPATRADRRRGEQTSRHRGEQPSAAGAPPVAPRVLAAAVAMVGAVIVVVGGLQATVFATPPVTRASLSSPGRPVVSTAVGLLGMEGPRLEVQVRDGSGRPVFVGIGRARDVDAYLGRVSRLEVNGYDGKDALLTRNAGSEASVPDPAGADVWVVSDRAPGSAGLVWPDAPGQWRLVAATDGTQAAPSLRLTWSGRQRHSSAPALISIGIVLLVGGGITVILLSSRSRWDREEEQ